MNKVLNKAFFEVSAKPQSMLLCLSGDKCNADNNSLSISILHACCQEYPTSVTFWECPIKHNLWKKVLCSSTTSRRSQECSHKSVFLILFNNRPSTIWPIMSVMWDKLRQVPQQAAPFILVTRRGALELLDSFYLLMGTQLVPLPSALPSCPLKPPYSCHLGYFP